jgi:hypothetical protein
MVESGEANVRGLEFIRQSTKVENASQRKNFKDMQRIPLEDSAEYLLFYAYKKTTTNWEKKQQRGIMILLPSVDIGPGIMFILPFRIKVLMTLGHWVKYS